jgi:hypothetical protein
MSERDTNPLWSDFARRRARGEGVMWVRASGAEGGLLVFAAGHFDGDLGEPRLNQRAALYAEAMLEKPLAKRPGMLRKRFDGPAGPLELEFLSEPALNEPTK